MQSISTRACNAARMMMPMLIRMLLLTVGLSLWSMSYGAEEIRLAAATSTQDSGLLDFLLPPFETRYGIKVRVIAAGTGKALKLGENGDVDAVLVHSRNDEDQFMAAGYGVLRRDLMENNFLLIGPPDDPAGINGMHDIVAVFKRLAETHSKFISRGDNSGTHKAELHIWHAAGITPNWSNYIAAGQGQGDTIGLASERQAYMLVDSATYWAYQERSGLAVLVESAARNPYAVIAVNPARHAQINHRGALQLIDWLTSHDGQQRIAAFSLHGRQLFKPLATQP